MDHIFRGKDDKEVRNDIYTTLALREAVLKEGYMQETELRIVKGVLRKCLVTEGENKYMVCNHLMQRYIELLRQPRITGYVNIDAGRPEEVLDATSSTDYMRKKGITKDMRAGM